MLLSAIGATRKTPPQLNRALSRTPRPHRNPSERVTPLMDRLIRILVILLLVGAAATIIIAGTEALPAWIRGMAARAGATPLILAKIVTGLLIALAGIILILGSRGRVLASICAAVFAFSGIADLAAWFVMENPGNILWPIAQLLAGGVPLVLSGLTTPAQPTPIQHPIGVGAGCVGSLLLGAIIAANITISESAPSGSGPTRFVTYDFEPDDWRGIPIEHTGLIQHLPSLGSLTQHGGPTSVVFYSPHCNVCHDFFKTRLPENPDGQIIAVKVPPTPGTVAADENLPEEIDCRKCTRLELPTGPIWLIQSPLALSVVDGVVTCVAESDQLDDMEACIQETMATARQRQENAIIDDGPPAEGPSLPDR